MYLHTTILLYLDTLSYILGTYKPMKIFGQIQKSLKKNNRQMASLCGLKDDTAWISFKASKIRLSLKPFFKLMRAAPISDKKILAEMKKELKL